MFICDILCPVLELKVPYIFGTKF